VSEHAKFSPSGAHRWMSCPASMAVESEIPDQTSAYAEEGTKAHALAEALLRVELNGCDGPDVFDAEAMLADADEDMREHVGKYVDLVLRMSQNHTLLVEQRVNFGAAIGVPEDEAFGTSDAVILTADGEELMVVDLKYGQGVRVSAEENEQLMLYALGALNEFAMLGDFKRVRLVIHQPRLDSVSEWDCTVEHLMAFAEKAKYAALQCQNASVFHRSKALEPSSSYFYPTNEGCRFCRYAGKCEALARHVNGVVFDDFEAIGEPLKPEQLLPDKLGRALDAAPLIEHWLKAVRAEAERQAFAGQPPIGKDGPYKLVQGRMGNRKFRDEAEAEAALKAMRLKQDEMYTFNLKTPPQLEKVLKENPRKWAKLQPLITQTEGGVSLAPATDKRPAFSPPSAVDDFTDLTGENTDVLTMKYNTPRVWRYDSRMLEPAVALHSTGVAAIDRTEEAAKMRVRVFLTQEKYGPVAA
jgi:hypothetical protein